MTPFRKRLTPITKRMAEDMLLRNMSVRSIDTYTNHVDRFAKHFGKQPEDRLRLTEATNLKAQHIDSERMQIKVVKGKGNRDRFVPP